MEAHGKHKHYEVLNLIGYGLAKFDKEFIKEFGFKTKSAFYNHIVKIGIAETTGTVKNRQDLFDPFFENARKGWRQKGNAYLHRKIFIDSLFGSSDASTFANIVQLYLQEKVEEIVVRKDINPITRSKFKQLQKTGQEAELFFMCNFKQISQFANGMLEDARMLGDGYDFQISVDNHYYLTEVKGVRTNYGNIRLTQNEFSKAQEFNTDYALVIVYNLNDLPKMNSVFDPLNCISFAKCISQIEQCNYNSKSILWTKKL